MKNKRKRYPSAPTGQAQEATLVVCKKTRIHKGVLADPGFLWLEFIVTHNRKRSVVAVPIQASTADEDVKKLKAEFIKQLLNENPTAKIG